MGCFYTMQLSEEKLIEILVEKRRNNLIAQKKEPISTLNLSDKKARKLQETFFKDINNLRSLVEYLDFLNSIKEKETFDYELFLYFDVLTVEYRKKFTGLKGFNSSLDIFLKVINLLSDLKFEEIKKLDAYEDKYDICGREILINSNNFSFKRRLKGKKGDKEYLMSKNNYIKKFLKYRKIQKISLNNPELYFNSLLQLYFETIEKADGGKKKNIEEIIKILYIPIKTYLNRIKKNEKLSKSEIKVLKILLFAPIIAENKTSCVSNIEYSYNNEINYIYNEQKTNNIKFFEEDNELKINYYYQNNSDGNRLKYTIKLENPNIYNKEFLKSELYRYRDKKFNENLTWIDLLKYVKIENFQEHNLYTHDKIYWEFNIKLIKNILQSNTIKTLFQNIFPGKIFIFENEENINELINSFIFVPYPFFKSYGCTYKNELLIFINGSVDSFPDNLIYLSKSSSLIILVIHEGCSHWASCFYSFLYQDNSLFKSMKFSVEMLIDMGLIDAKEKKIDPDIDKLLKQDGGDILEILLFGRKLTYFTVNEILFLLCKNSYKTDYATFKRNFKSVNNIGLKELFNKVIADEDLHNLMKYFKIDLDFFEKLKKSNNLNFSFKRNGEIISNSKCGNLIFY